jgi:AcrR family transcriptional regulator
MRMNAKKMISNAFYALLQRYSIVAVSVNMIVEAAEVSKPTFYRYYRDKYDLLGSMYDVIFQPMQEAGRTLSWDKALSKVLENLETT